MEIEFKSIQKKFISEKGKELEVLKDVDEKILNEEFVVLIGPSGCGKSTLLNIIAGLEKCTDGKIIVGGEEVINPSRDRGMVFQQDALLMWRKVIENVEYGLELSVTLDPSATAPIGFIASYSEMDPNVEFPTNVAIARCSTSMSQNVSSMYSSSPIIKIPKGRIKRKPWFPLVFIYTDLLF